MRRTRRIARQYAAHARPLYSLRCLPRRPLQLRNIAGHMGESKYSWKC